MQATTLQAPVVNRYREALWKYLKPGPAHLLMYTAGRFHTIRKVAVGYFRLKNRPKPSSASANFEPALETIDVQSVVTQLKQNGSVTGLRIRPTVLAELKGYCDTSTCYANGKTQLPFLASQKVDAEQQYSVKVSTGHYLDCSDNCITIQKILEDPTLVAIARGYLGAEPALVGARCWWSYATESSKRQQAADGQAYHYDLDDYRAICFFFYLTDVDEECGPHVCVLRSHRKKPVRWLFSPFKSRTDEDIEATYKSDQITTVMGKAGDGFAEDLFCYHKGSHPRSKDRLLLQVRYRLQYFGGKAED